MTSPSITEVIIGDKTYELRSVDKNDVTIVIPTLNEEEAIGLVIEGLFKENYHNIVVVDGNSIDRTAEIAESYDIDVIYQNGEGKTGAIETAIDYVVTPYLVIMDGDCTYNPKDINKFLPYLTYFDEVLGERSSGRENIRKLNRFGNWVINKTFNFFFGTRLNDVCTGLYALKTSFARNIDFDTKGFDVEVEIAAKTAEKGVIFQVPISYRERVGTQKLNPLRDGFKIMFSILKFSFLFNKNIFLSSIASMFTFLMGAMIFITSFLTGGGNYGLFATGTLVVMMSTQFFILSIIISNQKRLENKLVQKMSLK